MMGLGRKAIVNRKLARELAKAAWKKILNGDDPLENNSAARTVVTFQPATNKFIAAHAASWSNEKHAKQVLGSLERFAFPLIGDLDVQSIDTANVLSVLNQPYKGTTLWLAVPETANRVRMRLEAVLDFAKAHGWRRGENPARLRGHLDHLLPRRSGEDKHHAALDFADIPQFMADLRALNSIAARALEFTILTAARTNEVTQMRWSEVTGNVWVVPASRVKTKREHRVPLSGRAVQILNGLPRLVGNDFVFVGAIAGRPISNAAMQKVLSGLRPNATVHGMRATFRSWAASMTSFPREICEMALSHAVGSKTEMAYQRSDVIAKRRKLAEAWAKFINTPAGVVVPLRKAQQ